MQMTTLGQWIFNSEFDRCLHLRCDSVSLPKSRQYSQPLFASSLKFMGVYGFSSSDDDAEYTPPNEDVDQDKDGDRYVILIVLIEP